MAVRVFQSSSIKHTITFKWEWVNDLNPSKHLTGVDDSGTGRGPQMSPSQQRIVWVDALQILKVKVAPSQTFRKYLIFWIVAPPSFYVKNWQKLATFQPHFPIFNYFLFFSLELYVSQLMWLIVFLIPALTLQVTLGDNCRELSFPCFSDCSYIERKMSILSALISMTEKSSL